MQSIVMNTDWTIIEETTKMPLAGASTGHPVCAIHCGMAGGRPQTKTIQGSEQMGDGVEHQAERFSQRMADILNYGALNLAMGIGYLIGGLIIAEAVFGRLNPSGKLTISYPLHVGQQPVFYNQVRGQHGDRYADLTQEPLFPFGHGLSYTEYAYSNLRLDSATLDPQGQVVASVDVENVGGRAGAGP